MDDYASWLKSAEEPGDKHDMEFTDEGDKQFYDSTANG